MKLWIDDDYSDVIMLAILKEKKEMTEFWLAENDYLFEEDRLADIELLHGINIMLKHYEVKNDSVPPLQTTDIEVKFGRTDAQTKDEGQA